jgi:REP element-mobilizing transposase RayT
MNVQDRMAPTVKDALLGGWEPVYRSQLHYLVTWSTRGRRPVLRARHIEALRGIIERLCEERGYELLEFAAGGDHVHLLMGLRPAHSVASALREIKGRSAVTLLASFPELRVWLRGNLVWDERYSVETLSRIRIARVRERLRNAHGPDDRLAEAS